MSYARLKSSLNFEDVRYSFTVLIFRSVQIPPLQ